MKTNSGQSFPLFSPQELLQKVSAEISLPPAPERRRPVKKEMKRLADKGMDCWSCSGMCCRFEYNSMQIDPLQALELLAFLESQERLDQALNNLLEKSIVKFRLDKDFAIGKAREFRHSYTCPFYLDRGKGCSISRTFKPYGCLGFNPLEKNVSGPGKCASNMGLLTERENEFFPIEEKANNLLREKLGIYWEKKSIPFALKDMMGALKRKIQAPEITKVIKDHMSEVKIEEPQ